MKDMKKNSLDLAYLHQAVDRSKGDGCLAKACSDKFPEGSEHKAWSIKGLPSLICCLCPR